MCDLVNPTISTEASERAKVIQEGHVKNPPADRHGWPYPLQETDKGFENFTPAGKKGKPDVKETARGWSERRMTAGAKPKVQKPEGQS